MEIEDEVVLTHIEESKTKRLDFTKEEINDLFGKSFS